MMDTTLIVGLVVFVVVLFFGYQWFISRGKKSVEHMSPISKPVEEKPYPNVPGQTEAELRTPEPTQQRPAEPSQQQQPVTHGGLSSPQIEDSLQHPEQQFQQQPMISMMAPGTGNGGLEPFTTDVMAGGSSMFSYHGMSA